ncbi:sigma-70 family RNA polymerase sigma factor [Bordetella petrii]|uniref:sigma-70 family RNA polymerase sigma factor n=1 Tax=Bordetella petrii TaxID=94624 RepID=UPI001E373447|nr:sigma-70 family RNA polymerase sigma factor [Bordetella petrii]MCD0501659.1 sigma-70 family RNA polymerase sigma factor [Bordetella petrii]
MPLPAASAHPHLSRTEGVAALYQAHHTWLTGWLRGKLGNPHDAADVAHDTFVRVLQSRLAASIQEPRSYLSTIARGLVVDLWRRRALEQAYLEALEAVPAEHLPSLEAQALIQEQLVRLDRMLNGLGSKVKQAFLLSVVEGTPYPVIAERLGISVRTVSNYMAKAMERCCLLLD